MEKLKQSRPASFIAVTAVYLIAAAHPQKSQIKKGSLPGAVTRIF